MLRITVPNADDATADWLAGWLSGQGTCGIEQAEHPDGAEWRVYFEAADLDPDCPTRLTAEAIAAGFAGMTVSPPEGIAEENWHDGWREYFKPLIASPGLRVVPSWMKGEVEPLPGVTDIFIEPGMAFGTGTHARRASV